MGIPKRDLLGMTVAVLQSAGYWLKTKYVVLKQKSKRSQLLEIDKLILAASSSSSSKRSLTTATRSFSGKQLKRTLTSVFWDEQFWFGGSDYICMYWKNWLPVIRGSMVISCGRSYLLAMVLMHITIAKVKFRYFIYQLEDELHTGNNQI